ncbi:hypothetical protein GCM10017687_67850 [Streptomyces echinatus]
MAKAMGADVTVLSRSVREQVAESCGVPFEHDVKVGGAVSLPQIRDGRCVGGGHGDSLAGL